MYLYHFTNDDIEDSILKVNCFGKHSYTFNDTKYFVSRLFFYTCPIAFEYRFKNMPCYKASLLKKAIYDLVKDKLHLRKKYKDINAILEYCKKNYKGILYNVGYDIVSVFYDIKVKRCYHE